MAQLLRAGIKIGERWTCFDRMAVSVVDSKPAHATKKSLEEDLLCTGGAIE